MANFESGIASYITGECTIRVHFPVDDKGRAEICCRHCPYLSSNERMCQLNKQPVFFPNTNLGEWCPLEQTETNIKGEKVSNKPLIIKILAYIFILIVVGILIYMFMI